MSSDGILLGAWSDDLWDSSEFVVLILLMPVNYVTGHVLFSGDWPTRSQVVPVLSLALVDHFETFF